MADMIEASSKKNKRKRQQCQDSSNIEDRPLCDLCQNLLHPILSHHNSSLSAYLRCAAICPSWCSAIKSQPIPSPSAIIKRKETYYIVPHNQFLSKKTSNILAGALPILDTSSCNLRASFFGWLLFSKKSTSDLFLLNPISNARIHLPPQHHALVRQSASILLSSPPTDPNCVFFMLHSRCRNLEFCRPGIDESMWTSIWIPGIHKHDTTHLVSCNGNAYILSVCDQWKEDRRRTIAKFGRVIDVLGSNPRVSWINCGVRILKEFTNEYCFEYFPVESNGEILVVVVLSNWGIDGTGKFSWGIDRTRKFHLYKVEVETGMWSRVPSLPDRILYLEKDSSMSVSATRGRGRGRGGGNLIYLVEHGSLKCQNDGPIELRIGLPDALISKYFIYDKPFWFLPHL